MTYLLDTNACIKYLNDLLIASIALANNVILVTHNTREFNRVKGLKVEDWEK
jgi:tRNA(fMet)-specific endonuclease VapC